MSTAVKAKPVGRRLPPSSSPIEFPLEACKPLNREVYREPDARNSVPEPSSGFSQDFQVIDEVEEGRAAPTPSEQGWKRVLDVFCILVGLPFVLILAVLIVLWIRLVSTGPALFRQERIGKDGRRFVLYKFRTMKINSNTIRHEKHIKHLVESNSPMVKLDLLCDSRLISGGCILRAAGLDELPQLLNVLRGEMSLVGPRPCLPDEFHFFTAKQRVRFKALPGLTGIWQVDGKGISNFTEMNAMDALYVRKSSLVLDLVIMGRTPFALLRQMGLAFQQHRATARKSSFKEIDEPALSGYSTQRFG
jgi:lipopolysaccharide/colanic/teichoic acid biosynthesis glycosyltransferase